MAAVAQFWLNDNKGDMMGARSRTLLQTTVVFFLFLLPPYTASQADGGDAKLVHACSNLVNGNTRVVGADDACKNNETHLHWPRQIPPPQTDPAILGRLDALEAQVSSLQQDVASLLDFVTPPDLTVSDVAVPENCAAGGSSFPVAVTVSLTKPTQYVVSATYATADGTAVSSSPPDYIASTGVVSFQPGETAQAIDILAYCDRTPEFDEAFYVNLTNLQYANPAKTTGEVKLINDDQAQLAMLITTGTSPFEMNPLIPTRNVITDEGNSVQFEVRVNFGPVPWPIEVDYSVIGDLLDPSIGAVAATPDDFFVPIQDRLIIQPGEVSKTFTVNVADDLLSEGLEAFIVKLSNPVNAEFSGGADSVAHEIYLNDNDVSVTVAASPSSALEGTFALTGYSSTIPSENSVSILLTPSEPVAGPIYLQLFVNPQGSAKPARDAYADRRQCPTDYYFCWEGDVLLTPTWNYYNQAPVIRIDGGSTSFAQTAYILGDDIPEASETALIGVYKAWGGVSPQTDVSFTILDDD